jgi:dTDP-glucose 4,6-dehydratase
LGYCRDRLVRHFGISARIRAVFEELPHESSRVKVVTHDLTTPIDLVTAKEFGDPDVIINMASDSHVNRSITDPRLFVENNVALVLTLLDYARTIPNLKTFIQIGTDEVYGPAPEGINHPEWSLQVPSNPYSASKSARGNSNFILAYIQCSSDTHKHHEYNWQKTRR